MREIDVKFSLHLLQVRYPDPLWVNAVVRHWLALLAREATGGESGYQASRDSSAWLHMLDKPPLCIGQLVTAGLGIVLSC